MEEDTELCDMTLKIKMLGRVMELSKGAEEEGGRLGRNQRKRFQVLLFVGFKIYKINFCEAKHINF